MTVAWRLETLDGSQSYAFEINPNAQDSPFPNRDIGWEFHPSTDFTGRRAGRVGHTWSFSGVLRTQAQYDALLQWVGKRVKVRLIDDRGDKLLVRLVRFSPAQVGGARARHAPWRWTYSMDAMVYDQAVDLGKTIIAGVSTVAGDFTYLKYVGGNAVGAATGTAGLSVALALDAAAAGAATTTGGMP